MPAQSGAETDRSQRYVAIPTALFGRILAVSEIDEGHEIQTSALLNAAIDRDLDLGSCDETRVTNELVLRLAANGSEATHRELFGRNEPILGCLGVDSREDPRRKETLRQVMHGLCFSGQWLKRSRPRASVPPLDAARRSIPKLSVLRAATAVCDQGRLQSAVSRTGTAHA